MIKSRLTPAILALLLLSGCGKQIPKDVIRPDAMEKLLYDYHLASTLSNSLPYNEQYKKQAYMEYVFRKHGVTRERFDSSMVWYTRHGSELSAIYKNLEEKFAADASRMKNTLARRSAASMTSLSGDTVDLWQDSRIAVLTSSELTGKLSFELKADTAYHPNDRLKLMADFTFLPSGQKHTPKAVMGLCYYFDNDSIFGSTRVVSASGTQYLSITPDSAFSIRSVSGFISFLPQDTTSTVLLHNIRLFRYHTPKATAGTDSTHALSEQTDTVSAVNAKNPDNR